jgi:hypothetical protein
VPFCITIPRAPGSQLMPQVLTALTNVGGALTGSGVQAAADDGNLVLNIRDLLGSLGPQAATPPAATSDAAGLAFRLEFMVNTLTIHLGDYFRPGKVENGKILSDPTNPDKDVRILLPKIVFEYTQGDVYTQAPNFRLKSWGQSGFFGVADAQMGELIRMQPDVAIYKGGAFGISLGPVILDLSTNNTPPEILSLYGTDEAFTGVYAKKFRIYVNFGERLFSFAVGLDDLLYSINEGWVSLEGDLSLFGPDVNFSIEVQAYEDGAGKEYNPGEVGSTYEAAKPGHLVIKQGSWLQVVMIGGVPPYQSLGVQFKYADANGTPQSVNLTGQLDATGRNLQLINLPVPYGELAFSVTDSRNPPQQAVRRIELLGYAQNAIQPGLPAPTTVYQRQNALWVAGQNGDLYWSMAVGPVVNFFRDPNPPIVTDVPDVTLATLPDAANQSRITLTMDPPVLGAAGYVVWYATETQLLKALDEKGLLDWGLSPAQADALAHPAFANLDKRAEVLKDRINGSNAVDFAFTRITDKPVSDPKLEVTLPGDTTILHIYRFSTIGRNGLPSPTKSDITAVGVPRLAKPGVPGLIARPVYEPTPGIKLVAVPGSGEPSEGFRVFRTRREASTSYLGLMGPAIANESQAWPTEPTAFHSQTQDLPVFVDPQPISWFPYYYRVRAVGAVHPINGYQARDWGRYKGVSDPSVMVAVSLTPRQPPTLFNDADPQGLLQPILVNQAIQQQINGAHVWNVYSFETDLPIERSPLGVAKITILEMWKDSQNGGAYKTDVLFEAETHDRSKIPILPALPTPAMMNNEILFGAAHHYRALLRFLRSPDNAFPRQYYLYLETFDPSEEVLVPLQGWEPDPANPTPPPLVPVQVPVLDRRLRILRLTDPLGRTTDKALKTVIP